MAYKYALSTALYINHLSRTDLMYLVSPLPVIKNAAESEKMAADSRADRMTIWMKNVESWSPSLIAFDFCIN